MIDFSKYAECSNFMKNVEQDMTRQVHRIMNWGLANEYLPGYPNYDGTVLSLAQGEADNIYGIEYIPIRDGSMIYIGITWYYEGTTTTYRIPAEVFNMDETTLVEHLDAKYEVWKKQNPLD